MEQLMVGLQLLFIGMVIVFLVLIILLIIMKILAAAVGKPGELKPTNVVSKQNAETSDPSVEEIVVILAAISKVFPVNGNITIRPYSGETAAREISAAKIAPISRSMAT